LNNKRKAADEGSPEAEDPGTPGAAPKPKKRKSNAPVGDLTDQMVIEWLRAKPNASTRECIAHFQPWLYDAVVKQAFTELIKRTVTMKGGAMTLKKEYRSEDGATSINGTPTSVTELFPPPVPAPPVARPSGSKS
jgi:transcription initiation factor TFIIF subunit alpha